MESEVPPAEDLGLKLRPAASDPHRTLKRGDGRGVTVDQFPRSAKRTNAFLRAIVSTGEELCSLAPPISANEKITSTLPM